MGDGSVLSEENALQAFLGWSGRISAKGERSERR
jgi:hypothetical protein